MAEAMTITTRSPLNTILHPRARYALERALTRPADYLGCECCTSTNRASLAAEVHDRSTLPPTSLLLTMLNEAGNIVNVRDLWDAFNGTLTPPPPPPSSDLSPEPGDSEQHEAESKAGAGEGGERRNLALFYRGLSDLRHLGFVRPSKRKPGVDCIAKTVWMGL
jgi:origin recognition complex subunit 3